MLDELEKAWYIALKDMKAYYFKPPTISWGILFPLAFAFAFSLRNPQGLRELAPGLLAMSALFGTSSMSVGSIMFERRSQSFEQALQAPISLLGVVLGKALGGLLFGLLVCAAMALTVVVFFGASILHPALAALALLLSSFLFSAFGVFLALSVGREFDAMILANSIRLPMLFLSGVFIPVSRLPGYLRAVACFLPLTYTVDLLRHSLVGGYDLIPPPLSLLAILAMTAASLWGGVKMLERRLG